MTHQRTTLVISLGPLDGLDDIFKRLDAAKKWPAEPAKDWSGDVLLAGYGPEGSGGLHVFVGALFDPVLKDGELSFSRVQRFWHPVVAIYDAAGIRRADLIGDLKGWSPTEHFYAVTGVTAKVVAEAEASLRKTIP